MKHKLFVILLGILFIGLASAGIFDSLTGSYSNPANSWQSYQPNINQIYSGQIDDYWPALNNLKNDQCAAASDFIIGIPPGGCTPLVVRSDLLAEQNVPVFCQLYALQVNPLITVSAIKSISFKGDYPKGVAGISFHPARAAVRSYTTLLGSPTLNNIGYVVVILKQEAVEKNLEDWIAGNLTATISYDADSAYGTGRAEYYVPVIASDAEWENAKNTYSFWKGKGFLRVRGIDGNSAAIDVLNQAGDIFNSYVLREGETSPVSYLPGYYCKAGLKVRLDSIEAPEDSALINVDESDIWVRRGTEILNGACRVTSINIGGKTGGSGGFFDDLFTTDQKNPSSDFGVGSVKLSCSGVGENVILEISGGGGTITGQETWSDIRIGDILFSSKDNSRFEVTKIYPNGETFLNVDMTKVEDSKIILLQIGGNDVRLSDDGFTILEKNRNLVDYSDKDLDGTYERGTETVKELLDRYRSEARNEAEDPANRVFYGEIALDEQIKLASQIGKFASEAALIQLFLESYPDSSLANNLKERLSGLGNYDYSKAYKLIHVNGKFYPISVVKFDKQDPGQKSTNIGIDGFGPRDNLKEGQKIDLAGGNEYIYVRKIYSNRVEFNYSNNDRNAAIRRDSKTIYEGETKTVGVWDVTVQSADAKEVAHISLIPEVDNTESHANFSFRIGIEKRAIEITPEKAKKMVANLNESIDKFKSINEKLGKLISGWKGACFATSAVLMAKSAFDGVNGEAASRQKVMEQYRKICATGQYKELTRNECYNKLSGEIESSVQEMAAAMKSVNNKMQAAQKNNIDKGGGLFDSGSITNQEKYIEDLRSQLEDWKTTINGQELSASDLETTAQIRVALLDKQLAGKTGVVSDASKLEMESTLRNVAMAKTAKAENSIIAQGLNSEWGVKLGADDVAVFIPEGAQRFRWSGKTGNDFSLAAEEGHKVQAINIGGKNYLAVLGFATSADALSTVGNVYEKDGAGWKEVSKEEREKLLPTISKMVFYSSGGLSNECSNPWPEGKAQVSYYESGQNKGLPAIVPFDLRAGWYAMVPNSGGTFLDSSPQGYIASGDVSYFRICNIGRNSVMESGKGDDACQSFSVNNADDVKQFLPCPTIGQTGVRNLYSKAREAIRQASSQFGQKTISIFGEPISAGPPMSAVGGFECQDFMSVEDCKLMFNVCDPVICPPSRCDMGGKMPVTDVVQTGIIGSIALCLPNAKEGIYVPVCLTGIHAGIDAFTSILESERACLQKSIETGESVGICDEITSIYKCEFFWKQAAPLMNLIVPKLVETATGNTGVRGGGEYMFIQQAFNNLDKSVNYFQNVYAVNAFRAFQVRSTEEVGSQFCRAFIGTSVPSSANLLDSLLAPESPTQFYAYFSENSFSEATAPATSQYKVYYHIYAGNDQGSQYRVYLKNPPASSYYVSNPTISVKTGYIPRGESADESIDFTAPAGYKELCVVINADEKCGFRQVTTDFGLDIIRKEYVADQATKTDITSEKECISGSPSALALAAPNLQAGASEAINPEIGLRGIVRICATNNPGGFVQEGSRWKDVGYCGEQNLRCWLDIDSVKKDLGELQNFTGGQQLDMLNKSRGLLDNTRLGYEAVRAELNLLRVEIGKLTSAEDLKESSSKVVDIIFRLDRIIGFSDENIGIGTNKDRAEALALKAKVYRKIVYEIWSAKPDTVARATAGVVEVQKSTLVIPDEETTIEVTTKVLEDFWKDEIKGVFDAGEFEITLTGKGLSSTPQGPLVLELPLIGKTSIYSVRFEENGKIYDYYTEQSLLRQGEVSLFKVQ